MGQMTSRPCVDMVTIMATSQHDTTKKLLVAFDPSRADIATSDFVVPILGPEGVEFFGLRSRKAAKLGRMVYVGREVTVNDLFAKLVDTGRKIPDVEQTLDMLTALVSRLAEYKIGNVLSIESATDEPGGFRLKRIANTPSGASDAT